MTKGMAIQTLTHGNYEDYGYISPPPRGVSFWAYIFTTLLLVLENNSNSLHNFHA
jgi:hypothetical protein